MSLPLTIRKSSSTSTTASMEYQHILSDPSPSSPLLSSSPLRTPLHPTRHYEGEEWPACAYYDDLDRVLYGQQNDVEDPYHSHTCLEHPLPHTHQPLPSLMSKFATHKLQSDVPLSYGSSPFSSVTQTAYLYPQGDSTIADDWEEYDLESMDIHIRETYFATSAERGRWLSSPITTRVRSQVVPPARGHSSPLKKVMGATPSPTRGHLRKQKRACSAEKRVSISSADCNEDVCYSYSLPPSSPLSSPMSSFSLLGREGEDDSGDPHSNSDDRRSLMVTPELRLTSLSPVQPARTPHLRETPVIVSTLHPTGIHRECPGSTTPSHTSQLSIVLDMDTLAPCNTDFQSDIPFKPETDSPAAEPLKLPLSDTVNKPTWSQDGLPSSGSSSMNPCREFFDVSIAVGGVSGHTKTKKKRTSAGAKQTKKHATAQRSPSLTVKRRTECRTDAHSESASKRSKLVHRRYDSETHNPKALLRHDGITKVEQPSRSPSCSAFEPRDSETACPPDERTRGDEDQTRLRYQISTPVTVDTMNAEFHASLTGMLIEAFATSRATSMDSLALHGVLTRSHPHLVAQRSKKELLEDITAVLEGGRARCGMFEKVDSSYEKSRDKALENRWFYVAERDEDSERAALVIALMPRQKRKETKKYKQYYYRPLDKISRWDPEDAL